MTLVNGFRRKKLANAIALVNGYNTSALRNNFTEGVGFQFTPVVDHFISQLGRHVASGNSGSHDLIIVNTATTIIAQASLNTLLFAGGTDGYVSIAPLLVLAGVSYFYYSKELSGGDQWYDLAGTTSYQTGVATINAAAYQSGTVNNVIGSAGQSYARLHYKYFLP